MIDMIAVLVPHLGAGLVSLLFILLARKSSGGALRYLYALSMAPIVLLLPFAVRPFDGFYPFVIWYSSIAGVALILTVVTYAKAGWQFY